MPEFNQISSSQFTEEFKELISKANSIVVTSHMSPDDDSIGSVLSIRYFLKKNFPNKKIRVVYTGLPVDKYEMFEGFDEVEFVEDLADNLGDADMLIMIDGSQFGRFTKKPEVLSQFKGTTICIDHHSSPVDKFTLALVEPSASSSCEIIYFLFFVEGLDKASAELLMVGLLGDTGNFTYLRPHDQRVFDMAKHLVRVGDFEIQEFLSRYRKISQRIFIIIQEMVKNSSFNEVEGWPKYMTSFISLEFKEKEKYTDNEVSEASHIYMSNYLRTIQDYPWGFIVTPKVDGRCGISFRSLPGSVNVRNISERMEIGGGHDRASGGMFKPSDEKPILPDFVFKKMEEWLKSNPVVLS